MSITKSLMTPCVAMISPSTNPIGTSLKVKFTNDTGSATFRDASTMSITTVGFLVSIDTESVPESPTFPNRSLYPVDTDTEPTISKSWSAVKLAVNVSASIAVKELRVPPELETSASSKPSTASLNSKTTRDPRSESLRELATISTVTVGFCVSTLNTSSSTVATCILPTRSCPPETETSTSGMVSSASLTS